MIKTIARKMEDGGHMCSAEYNPLRTILLVSYRAAFERTVKSVYDGWGTSSSSCIYPIARKILTDHSYLYLESSSIPSWAEFVMLIVYILGVAGGQYYAGDRFGATAFVRD